MDLIADALLFLTALTSGLYCLVLARRLKRLGSADDGIGQKIEALSAAIGETRTALGQTQSRLDEMRKEANASGERVAREGARAKRLLDELSAVASEAERTLDALYRAETRVAGAASEPRAEPRPPVEIAEGDVPDPGPADAGGEGPGTPEPRVAAPAREERLDAWSGGDVLKVERMAL